MLNPHQGRRSDFLAFSPPSIGDEEVAEVARTLRSDWITTGPKVKQFETDFAAFVGAPAALALSSATAALHLGLVTLKIGPGDAVISTPMTFCSSIHVIEHVGAKPILVDVERDTLNIDPKCIEKAVEQAASSEQQAASSKHQGRVRAILPVHLYGHPCDMTSILELATRYQLAVVEDAAHALPAGFNGRMIGAAPGPGVAAKVLTAFSFYATKNVTTAEGGMLTGPPDLLEDSRIWSLHGMSRDAWKRYASEGSWYYEVVQPGFKYNMTDIQAAIGIHQLKRLPQLQQRRREIFQDYNRGFSDLKEIEVPTVRADVEHAWHLYVLRLNLDALTINRARFIEELTARNIGSSVHFIPIHLHPYYRDKYAYQPDDFPVTLEEYRRIVSLPLYPRMTDDDVTDVIEAVREIVRRFRR